MARPLKENENENTIIKQIMREKGITVDMLAQAMGKAKTTVSIQLSNSNMTISTLANIAEALGVEISDLFPVPSGYVHWMEAKRNVSMIKDRHEGLNSDEMVLFRKFKAMLEAESNDPSLLVNNPAFDVADTDIV